MKKLILLLVAIVAFALCGSSPPAPAGSPYTATVAQFSGKHYVRAGEFVGNAELQEPTTNTQALVPFVCQHDLVVERLDVWGQVQGLYRAELWMAGRASYTTPPAYADTGMAAEVQNTTNIGSTEERPVRCLKGDFLLVRIDADVNPEYIKVFARIAPWVP